MSEICNMKILTFLVSFLFFVNTTFCQNDNAMEKTIYQFKVKDIDENTFDFESLKGKKIMIVNTASKCGLTPQYKELQKLYDRMPTQPRDLLHESLGHFGGPMAL